jgi:hypothetical protein
MSKDQHHRDGLPLPPSGCSETAVGQWWAVVEAFELEDHEVALLREVCRTITVLDALDEVVTDEGLMTRDGKGTPKVHPAVVESRQLRITLARLFAALRLPEGAEDERRTSGTADGRPQRRGAPRGLYAVVGQ